MKSTLLRLGCLLLAMSVVGPAPAQANIWDWLEELNGPGPSRSRGNFMVNLLCEDTTGLHRPSPLTDGPNGPNRRALKRFMQIPKEPGAQTTCLYLDQRWLHAEDDTRFHPVNISITEFGSSVWLHRTVELGAGVGVMKFSSRNPETNQKFSGARMTISFPRLVFRPLLAIPSKRTRADADWGFLQIYFKESIVVGDLSDADFASKPGTEFSRRHQRVESMGFIVDVTALSGLLRKNR